MIGTADQARISRQNFQPGYVRHHQAEQDQVGADAVEFGQRG
jgi:hypothetical protein